jgi:hypothetical protein
MVTTKATKATKNTKNRKNRKTGATFTLTAAEVRQLEKALAIVRRVRRAADPRARIRAEG